MGQPGAGTDLITNTGVVKVKHEINSDWNIEVGGLYQDSVRNLFGITNTLTDNLGNYTVTKNFDAVPHFTIGSFTASLNGRFDLFGFTNEVTLGTNGFVNGQYLYKNTIMTQLGSSNLANPAVLPNQPIPANGGQFKSAELSNQTIVTADTFHFNDQWAVQGVVSTSFLHSESWSKTGVMTSANDADGVFSPTVSLIYKPTSQLTTYATFARSVEQSDQAPTGTANANQFLTPYQDEEYEVGVKYAITPQFLAIFDLFHMTRPFASTDPITNIFAVVGTQRNNGAEFFLQGNILPELSIFGGITYIDARLQNTGLASTNDKLVVGVPQFKSDAALDYHPAFLHGFQYDRRRSCRRSTRGDQHQQFICPIICDVRSRRARDSDDLQANGDGALSGAQRRQRVLLLVDCRRQHRGKPRRQHRLPSGHREPTWPVSSWISEFVDAADVVRCGRSDRSSALTLSSLTSFGDSQKTSREAIFQERHLLVPTFLAGEPYPGRAFFGRDTVWRTAFAAGRLDAGVALLDDDGLLRHRFADQPLGFFAHRLLHRHPARTCHELFRRSHSIARIWQVDDMFEPGFDDQAEPALFDVFDRALMSLTSR